MKLRKKMFLSATALAACAATLTTTTYAWYVTNSEATVTGITGSVSSTGAEGNLLVAYDTGSGEDLDFSQTLNLASYVNITGSGLVPVSYNTTDKKWHDNKGDETSKSAVTFRIWVKSTTKTEIYPTVTFKNTTTSTEAKSQKLQNSTGAPTVSGTKVKLFNSFTSNALYAIRMGIQQSDVDNKESNKSETPINDARGALADKDMDIYNPGASFADEKSYIVNGTAADAAAKDFTTTGDANAYYAALLNEAPYGTTASHAYTYEELTIAKGTAKSAVAAKLGKADWYTEEGNATTGPVAEKKFDVTAFLKDESKTNFTAGEDGAEDKLTAELTVYRVKSNKVTAASLAESSTKWEKITVLADNPTLLEFTIWLEGTDAQCFDSCKGQTFDVDFSFASKRA